MKYLKRTIPFIIIIAIIIAFIYNYPKLNIIAGYSAKSTASSVFLANRPLEFTDSTDNNFSPINLASDEIDLKNKIATSSAFGLLTRKAVYRNGVGSVLILSKDDINASFLTPKRLNTDSKTSFPFGNGPKKDTVFSNINYEKLNKAINFLFDKKNKTRTALIVYKNYIIAEKYADGFSKNSKLLGWSMTKSLLSTVFGIMQYQGKLDINDKTEIASWQNDERKNITISNLLQMNSGLEWDENYDGISDVTKMLFLERDMTKTQENKPLIGKPNKTWNYSSGTSNLLSGILRTKFETQQKYLDFWYTDFIDKIGMNSMIIETDLSGNYVASSYSWATTRDWAKFGLLYLNSGNWNGTQLFDKSWIDYTTTPTPASKGEYGAHFWLNDKPQLKNVPKSMYFADGYQGQRVYIFPKQNLVVVRFGLSNFNENTFLTKVLKSIN